MRSPSTATREQPEQQRRPSMAKKIINPLKTEVKKNYRKFEIQVSFKRFPTTDTSQEKDYLGKKFFFMFLNEKFWLQNSSPIWISVRSLPVKWGWHHLPSKRYCEKCHDTPDRMEIISKAGVQNMCPYSPHDAHSWRLHFKPGRTQPEPDSSPPLTASTSSGETYQGNSSYPWKKAENISSSEPAWHQTPTDVSQRPRCVICSKIQTPVNQHVSRGEIPKRECERCQRTLCCPDNVVPFHQWPNHSFFTQTPEAVLESLSAYHIRVCIFKWCGIQ